MKWLEYIVVPLIFIVALYLAFRSRRSDKKHCADCPLSDTCARRSPDKRSR